MGGEEEGDREDGLSNYVAIVSQDEAPPARAEPRGQVFPSRESRSPRWPGGSLQVTNGRHPGT